jgi:HSP20 family protein
MANMFSDPFASLLNLQQALESLQASGWLDSGPSGEGPYPPVNVFRKADDFVMITEVPGVDKSSIQIQVKGDSIRIGGKKSFAYPEKASLHRRERLAGVFDRTIKIPVQIDPDKVKAESRDGILAVFLARAERDKPKAIKVD